MLWAAEDTNISPPGACVLERVKSQRLSRGLCRCIHTGWSLSALGFGCLGFGFSHAGNETQGSELTFPACTRDGLALFQPPCSTIMLSQVSINLYPREKVNFSNREM